MKTEFRKKIRLGPFLRVAAHFTLNNFVSKPVKEHLAIRRIFSLVDMITNTKFSNCPNVFEIGVVWQ